MRFAFTSRVDAVNERDLVVAYLNKVKEQAGVSSDAELADCLEVGKATISAWRQRGNVPFKMQKAIHEKYGVVLEGSRVHLPKKTDFSSHIGALVFFTILTRGGKISFGGKVETAYWWTRRVPHLTQLLGDELVKRCRARHKKLNQIGIPTGFFDAHSLKDDELRDAVEEIAFDIEEERFLRLAELESLPYQDR
jgi:hypothetical protein